MEVGAGDRDYIKRRTGGIAFAATGRIRGSAMTEDLKETAKTITFLESSILITATVLAVKDLDGIVVVLVVLEVVQKNFVEVAETSEGVLENGTVEVASMMVDGEMVDGVDEVVLKDEEDQNSKSAIQALESLTMCWTEFLADRWSIAKINSSTVSPFGKISLCKVPLSVI
ncbi:hypothetical protein TELCIR_01164 [Teladorsagia circumcincta]|uniref:Uncharacterized protein n=1 Tax=Teladorsagia circumcincta TaxID=45464 RepID=A0A2G9V2L6_TELCI|nr:hypothetical protein TELCIR_01164 [Teladorsagia circumcincta]